VGCPTPTQYLPALTHYRLVHKALEGTTYEGTPILATAAAHGAGGRDGLGNYVHVPKGDVLRRHLSGLNPFANLAVGVKITGKTLRTWLEHSALLFRTLQPHTPDQMLVDRDVPAFQFDTVFGITYTIDPSAPPFVRIRDLCFDGDAVEQDQQFILATNQFRVAGGGGYAPPAAGDVVTRPPVSVQSEMIATLGTDSPAPWHDAPPWRFTPAQPVRAFMLTHPDALAHLSDIGHLSPIHTGSTADGFIRLSVSL
jgi:2',3'-cyclic-nucleotide 2'-phosphodiesterase/3'-nucleotidase